jgi:hypothetical protein
VDLAVVRDGHVLWLGVGDRDGELAGGWVAANVGCLDFDRVIAVGVRAGVEGAFEPEVEGPGAVRVVLGGVWRVGGVEVEVGCRVALDVGAEEVAMVDSGLPGEDLV